MGICLGLGSGLRHGARGRSFRPWAALSRGLGCLACEVGLGCWVRALMELAQLSVCPPWQLLARDLRGEMTLPAVDELRPSLRGSTPGRGVARLLSLSQVLSSVGEGVWAVGP